MKGKSKRSSGKNSAAALDMKNIPVIKAEPTECIVLQFGEYEVPMAAISDKAKQNYKESGNKAELKDIKIYVKPEDLKAYYVVNGEFEGNVDLVSDESISS